MNNKKYLILCLCFLIPGLIENILIEYENNDNVELYYIFTDIYNYRNKVLVNFISFLILIYFNLTFIGIIFLGIFLLKYMIFIYENAHIFVNKNIFIQI